MPLKSFSGGGNWGDSSSSGGADYGPLGNGISSMINNFKQQQNQAKATDYMIKAHPELMDQMGVSPEQYATFGARDKVQFAQGAMGIMQKQREDLAQQEQAARIADMMSQGKEREAFGAHRAAMDKLAADQAERTQGFNRMVAANLSRPSVADAEAGGLNVAAYMARLAGAQPGQSVDPGNFLVAPGPSQANADRAQAPMDMNYFLKAGAQSGTLTPDTAMRMMAERGAAGRKQTFFDASDLGTDLPGTQFKRIPTGPNSAQLVYNGQDVGTPVPQHDEEGNLIGYSTVDAKGTSRFTKAKLDSPITAMKDESGNPLPGMYRMGDKVVDTRTAMQKMTGQAGGSAAAKTMTPDLAQKFLADAGGDKAKARAAAQAAGYTF